NRASGISNTTSAITFAPVAGAANARCSACDQAVVFLAGQLQIVPRHPLEALPGIAQQERGMKRRDEDTGAVRIRLAPELGDAFLGAEERLRGEVAEGEDHHRLDGL